jgi:hypothetical protein
MDVDALHRFLIAFLLSLSMRTSYTSQILLSLFVIVAAVQIAVKAFGRPFDRSLALPISATTIASILATYMTDYIVNGKWEQFFPTYIFTLEVVFDIGDPLRALPKALDIPSLLPSTPPDIDAKIFTSLQTFDISKPADYLFPVSEGLVVPVPLWPSYNTDNHTKLFLCAVLVFYITTLQSQKVSALLKHIYAQRLAAEQQQIKDEATADIYCTTVEQDCEILAAIAEIHRIEGDGKCVTNRREYEICRLYDNLCGLVKE